MKKNKMMMMMMMMMTMMEVPQTHSRDVVIISLKVQ